MLSGMASFCLAPPHPNSLHPLAPPISIDGAPVPTFGVIRLSPTALPLVLNLRLKNTRRLHLRQHSVSTSASNSPNGNSREETTPPESAQGPPFLTILAGFFVLFLICWGISGVVMWLINFVAKLISSN